MRELLSCASLSLSRSRSRQMSLLVCEQVCYNESLSKDNSTNSSSIPKLPDVIVQRVVERNFTAAVVLAVLGAFLLALPIFWLLQRRLMRRRGAHLYWTDTHETAHVPDKASLGVGIRFHLFLSHKWPTGQQQVHTIRERFLQLLPSCLCFLDVFDLQSPTQLEQHVNESAVVLIFLSRAYLQSHNCMRELRAAKAAGKPVIVAYEPNDEYGGGEPEALIGDCPTNLRSYLTQRNFIRWSIKPGLQNIALTLIAERLIEELLVLKASHHDMHAAHLRETLSHGVMSEALNDMSHMRLSFSMSEALQIGERVVARHTSRSRGVSAAAPSSAAAEPRARRLVVSDCITLARYEQKPGVHLSLFASRLNPGARAMAVSLLATAGLHQQIRVSSSLLERMRCAEERPGLRKLARKLKKTAESLKKDLSRSAADMLEQASSSETEQDTASAEAQSTERRGSIGIFGRRGSTARRGSSARRGSTDVTDPAALAAAAAAAAAAARKRWLGALGGVKKEVQTAAAFVEAGKTYREDEAAWAADAACSQAAIVLQTRWRALKALEPQINSEEESCLVVLLNKQTWEGQRGQRLARQVSRIHSAGARVFLLHDVTSCAFRDVMEATPRQLVEDGLYANLATDVVPGRAEEVSAAHFAAALGCVRKATQGPQRRRSSKAEEVEKKNRLRDALSSKGADMRKKVRAKLTRGGAAGSPSKKRRSEIRSSEEHEEQEEQAGEDVQEQDPPQSVVPTELMMPQPVSAPRQDSGIFVPQESVV